MSTLDPIIISFIRKILTAPSDACAFGVDYVVAGVADAPLNIDVLTKMRKKYRGARGPASIISMAWLEEMRLLLPQLDEGARMLLQYNLKFAHGAELATVWVPSCCEGSLTTQFCPCVNGCGPQIAACGRPECRDMCDACLVISDGDDIPEDYNGGCWACGFHGCGDGLCSGCRRED